MSRSKVRPTRRSLILCNSLGTNLHMWDEQAKTWAQHFRLVRYDRRGHGKSGVPKGPYTMDRLGRDVLAIADHLGIKTFNWCGLSMGGMVGQWLGANAPDRVEKLVLSNTNYYYADKQPWNDRIKFVQEKGLERAGRHADGALVHQAVPRQRRSGHRQDQGDVPRHQAGRLHRLLARRCATWTSGNRRRASPRRRW